MKQVPFQVHDITKPSELFGRKRLLDNLIVSVTLQQNLNIIGARRFGKTCLVKTAYQIIRDDNELKTYPIYLDFKDCIVQGTGEVYKYMIGSLIESLYKDGIFTEKETISSVEIIPSDDWTVVIDQFISLSVPRLQSLLTTIIQLFSELIDKTILFIIDEYEYLFKYSLDNPSGFARLRSLSSALGKNDNRFFCFWLVGAMSWDEFCKNVPGSGDSNTVSDTYFVTPIDRNSFDEMWKYECDKVDDETVKEFLLSNIDFAYKKSGGVPFYGKDKIGAFMMKNCTQPDYSICIPPFKELVNKAMSSGEYKILKTIALHSQKIEKSNNRTNLINKGLVEVSSKEKLRIRIEFLTEFIIAEENDNNALRQQKSEIEILVRDSMKLIEVINNQMTNHNKPIIFKPVNDSFSLELDLRTQCYNEDQFSDFTVALYNVFFERSKEGRGNLHNPFFSETDFAKCVDIARHSFGHGHEMDNFVKRSGQFSKADMLIRLYGKPDEPYSLEDWQTLQIAMLRMFKSELDRLLLYLRR